MKLHFLQDLLKDPNGEDNLTHAGWWQQSLQNTLHALKCLQAWNIFQIDFVRVKFGNFQASPPVKWIFRDFDVVSHTHRCNDIGAISRENILRDYTLSLFVETCRIARENSWKISQLNFCSGHFYSTYFTQYFFPK